MHFKNLMRNPPHLGLAFYIGLFGHFRYRSNLFPNSQHPTPTDFTKDAAFLASFKR